MSITPLHHYLVSTGFTIHGTTAIVSRSVITATSESAARRAAESLVRHSSSYEILSIERIGPA